MAVVTSWVGVACGHDLIDSHTKYERKWADFPPFQPLQIGRHFEWACPPQAPTVNFCHYEWAITFHKRLHPFPVGCTEVNATLTLLHLREKTSVLCHAHWDFLSVPSHFCSYNNLTITGKTQLSRNTFRNRN